MKTLINLAIISIFTLSSCQSSKEVVLDSKKEDTVKRPVESNKATAVYWQQNSAEYEALCYQAFNAAQSYLNQFLDNYDAKGNFAPDLQDGRKKAIIIDLDETVLNNSPYNGYLLKNQLDYSYQSWIDWTSTASAELIPGALEFINNTNKAGIEIFFISNRSEEELAYTVQNLTEKGVQFKEENLLLGRLDLRSQKDFRRNAISPAFDIIMLIGDNLADFHEVFESDIRRSDRKEVVETFQNEFGKKYIILPNVMYGGWEPIESSEDPMIIEPIKELDQFIESFK